MVTNGIQIFGTWLLWCRSIHVPSYHDNQVIIRKSEMLWMYNVEKREGGIYKHLVLTQKDDIINKLVNKLCRQDIPI